MRRSQRGRQRSEDVVYRWDLDKTYLRTEFERFRDLIRVPFEKAADKIDVPGVAELIRSLREHARGDGGKALVYFISASPPQMARAIREKFALDGTDVDGIVFKDQLQILMRGKIRGLREQVGFKLTELLRGRLAAPKGAIEYCFGDDWEADPVIYSIYADLVAGRLDHVHLQQLLAAVPVDRGWCQDIEELVSKLGEPDDAVRKIFINLERRTPLAAFRPFGPRVVPTFNYFQTAVCLYEEGRLDARGVERVARALIGREGYTPEMLENSLGDVARRGAVGVAAHERIADTLRRDDLLPRRPERLRERVRRWLGRRRRPDPAPLATTDLDYSALVAGWRPDP